MDQCSIRVGAGIAPFIILIVTRAKVGLPMILWEDISPTVKIKNLNVRKSYGWDVTAPPKLFKGVAEGIAPSLTRLYNNCIDLGEWPSEWKKGEWTPVFKKGDRQDKLNYRPITSLNLCVDKIFEHLLSKQVTRHYDPALYHRMTAYRKQHSCETTLLMLIEDWRSVVDRKELVTILSADMSKAFDSLSYSLTLKKLDAYGFNSISLELIRSFFDSRLNRVKINGHTGEWRIMERGCPQGSSFGPLLWNMFQNDMAFHIPDSNLTLYADDHQLYVTGKTYEEVESTLVTQGQQALLWYRDNFLLANPDKFQSLTINPRNIDADKKGSVLTIANDEIMKIEQIKLLGVNIDKNLNFTQHISEICTKASQKVGVLMRLRNLIPCQAKLILYKTAIMPHLTYCHLVWNFCKSSDGRKIERIQERALRAVFKTTTETYEELLKRAKLPTRHNRRLQDIAILMYKVNNDLVPSYISEIFTRKGTRYNLRNSDFEIPRFNTIRYGKHTLRYQGPYIWSKLENGMRELPSLSIFKIKIRRVDLVSLVEDSGNCCNLCST